MTGIVVEDNTPSMEEQNAALRANAIAIAEQHIAELEAALAWWRIRLAEIRRIKP